MAELTDQQGAELRALEEMPDEEIDFSDIPEGPLNPANIRRGALYEPVKQPATFTPKRVGIRKSSGRFSRTGRRKFERRVIASRLSTKQHNPRHRWFEPPRKRKPVTAN